MDQEERSAKRNWMEKAQYLREHWDTLSEEDRNKLNDAVFRLGEYYKQKKQEREAREEAERKHEERLYIIGSVVVVVVVIILTVALI